MFHSAARSIQGAQITPVSPADGYVTIIGPVPEGHTRYWVDSDSGKNTPFGWQKPTLFFGSPDPGLGQGLVELYVKDKDGQLYLVHPGASAYNIVTLPLASVLLGPGESVVAKVLAAGFVSPLIAFAYFQDLQGPFAHKRTPITDVYQDIIPSPQAGKIHTPIGWIGYSFFMNGFLTMIGAAGGAIDSKVTNDGVTLDTVAGGSAAPGAVTALAPSSTPNFASFYGAVPMVEGMAVQAKKAAAGGAVGAVAFTSYLVTTAP